LTGLWIALPVIFVMAIPFGHALRIRYFLFALPVFMLLVAYAVRLLFRWLAECLELLRRRVGARAKKLPSATSAAVAILLLGVMVASALPSVADYYSETKQGWRSATRVLTILADPGDRVFVRHVYQQVGVLYYAGLLGQSVGAWTEANVQVLPRDPTVAFPPEPRRRGWLVVPLMDSLLPGGSFEASIQPHYRLESPIVLPAPRAPDEAWIISPPAFRSVAVVPVVPHEQPSVRFWADDYLLARGNCTWLRWAVDRVHEVYLDGVGVVGHGELQVCPQTTTRFELSVTEMDGSVRSEAVDIEVSAP
jgi:hypothetical protein